MTKIKHLLLFALCCIMSTSLYAQKSARISGTVYSDAEGPLMMVNITERDANNRIIEAAITDMEGNFSMVVKNTSNKLEVSYIGYKTQILEIGSKTVFNIKLVEDNIIDEVVITAKEQRRTGALDILEREVAQATQKFSMSEMEGLSFTSVDEALQGQIAGLDIVFNSGDLGAGTQMRLRGTSTINGNAEPLIVVDDVILELAADETSNLDYSNLTTEAFSELLSVNPEDIEEIEVLKDAAACAVWGSRGANGVIKIKTKRGKRGPTRVGFMYKFTDSWMPEGLNLLNGDDYTMLLKESHFNPKQNSAEADMPEISYNPNFEQYHNYNKNTDWVDAVSKHGYKNDYSLNISGGGERATFRISGNYGNATGSIIEQYMQTFSTRMSLDYIVSDRIKVSAQFAFSYSDNKKNYDSLLSIAQEKMPNMAIYYHDKDGNQTDDYYKMLNSASEKLKGSQGSMRNPVASAALAKSDQESYSITPQINLEYKLLGLEDKESRLDYRGMVYLNASTLTNTSYLPAALSKNAWTASDINTSNLYDSKSLQFTTRHNLVFTPYLGNSDHYLTMSGQFEVNTSNSTTQNQATYGLPAGINSTTVGSYLSTGSTTKGQSRSMNFTYQAHYSYKSKYVVAFSARGEGHTQFGENKKWVVFPSVSLRWNITDEPWMEWAKPALSMLSIRPSFGLVGETPGQEYLMYTTYTPQGTYLGMTGFVPGGVRLTEIRASDKREFNIGTDFELFDNIFGGAFNYYKNTTYDQLMGGYSIPTSTGHNQLAYKNTGAVSNSGWELNFNLNRLKLVDELRMSLNFNVGQNFNEIKEMEASILKGRNPDYGYSNGEYLGRIQVGNPLSSIYGLRYKGVYRYSYRNWEKALAEAEAGRDGTCPIVYDADGKVVYNADGTPKQMVFNYDTETGTSQYKFSGGDAIYEDINHDGNINELDLVYLGNSNPQAQGGFGLRLEYKRLSFRANFTYRWNVDVINNARMQVENMHTHKNQSIAVNWRWRKEGDITEIPRALYNTGYNWLGSDRYVEDASYLRLSYLQLSYSFDREKLKKLGMQSLSLYASANNLWFWSKYTGLDPEVATGPWGRATDNAKTPRTRSYTVTLNVGF